ncbi:MAG: XTP/dITP diphosphohydrolase [Acidobacteriaceae bacterium]|jgi:XTP/dITP diphosphohydrolase|nr:XTP/dITP diphosphohydrolase [Acidobacteriaceae bacterium]
MARMLYVASTNPGKLRDFSLAASRHGIEILPLPRIQSIEAPAEDAPTFADNASEKAIYYSRFLPGEMVLADDSGLEVDFLQGAPGVRSARFAADTGFREANTPDANNNLFLLQQLGGVADSERGARYRCALAVAQDGVPVIVAEGAVEGRILSAPRGNGGFGYDPLFYVPALDRTMAEIDDQARWTHSHRGEAFRALLEVLV